MLKHDRVLPVRQVLYVLIYYPIFLQNQPSPYDSPPKNPFLSILYSVARGEMQNPCLISITAIGEKGFTILFVSEDTPWS